MENMKSWVKNHKLVVLLGIIVVYLLLKNNSPQYSSRSSTLPLYESAGTSLSSKNASLGLSLPVAEAPPTTDVTSRMVIKDTYMSLQVNKVVDAQKNIIKKAEELGGYMVSSSLTNPQDVPSATVIVRVPAKKLDAVLVYFRSLAVKVISENLNGQDVTDQYVDLEARLATYVKTKEKFDAMLDKAVTVQETLEVQREIVNIQMQIDSIKGQQDYLKKNAEMAKVTIYLSTDEFALPYAPTEAWRPGVIFKEAVRSVVGTARWFAGLIIWLAVYAIIWVPILLIVLFIRRRKQTPKL